MPSGPSLWKGGDQKVRPLAAPWGTSGSTRLSRRASVRASLVSVLACGGRRAPAKLVALSHQHESGQFRTSLERGDVIRDRTTLRASQR